MEWSHGKMDPSWNSSLRLVDLTSFSAPLELIERLRPAWLIMSEPPEQRNCDTSWTADQNTVDSPNWSFFRQIQFTHVVHNSLQNFILQTISKSATTTMWPFNTVFLWLSLECSNLLIPLDSSHDFSDVPISLFLGNNYLQCKQCAYRPSYRCQQLRRNYIINYIRSYASLYYMAYTCYNRWAITTLHYIHLAN